MQPPVTFNDEAFLQNVNEVGKEQHQRRRSEEWPPGQVDGNKGIDRRSITVNMLSTLLLRITNRISFVLLSLYLGAHFASAALVVVILEAFYISELILAPLAGSLSDRVGRKPLLCAAPILGAGANLCLLGCVWLFPHPTAALLNIQMVVLLVLILAARLLEGTTTAINTPASLGYIADTTHNSERLRTRVMTAFEVATIGGIAAGLVLGGKVSSLGPVAGFMLVIGLHLANIIVIACFVKESAERIMQRGKRNSVSNSLRLLRDKRVYAFMPAWLAISALIGAWMTLIILMLTYPDAEADLRHPGQLFYGGFSSGFATMLLGGFGLLFLLGMGGWMLVMPRLRRTTVLLSGLGGLGVCVIVLTIINSLPEHAERIEGSSRGTILALLPLVIIGVLLLSGFTPAALTHIAAIAERQPERRGATMGLYSVVLAMAQLIGAVVGGMAVDVGGFYGLMVFSAILGLIALGSVCWVRLYEVC